MYKIYFLTFGCKVNQYETDSLKSQFTKMGFSVTDSPAEADAAVVNSCTVTSGGDSKSLYAVRKLRRDCPDAVIVLTGCLPQAAGKPDIPEADIITGTKDRHLLPGMVLDALQNGGKTVSIPEYSPSDAFETMEYTAELHRTRAYIKIQDGCNCFCSYCIIPYQWKPEDLPQSSFRRPLLHSYSGSLRFQELQKPKSGLPWPSFLL